MSDVYLSYVEEDADVALEIATGLEAAGFTTYHHEKLFLGDSYINQFDAALDKATAVFMRDDQRTGSRSG